MGSNAIFFGKEEIILDSPIVSIIMPTYNRAPLISEAIESVIAQEYPAWELIIVDDGSSDGTDIIVSKYVQADERIKYFYQSNQGQSSARNFGIEQSRGHYIAFLDSDNQWFPHRLRVGIEAFSLNPDVILCYGNAVSIDIYGNEIHRKNMKRYSGYVFPKLMVDNFISMNSVLVRKSAFASQRPFNEKNRLDEDYELWLGLSVNNRFHFIDQYIVRYRIEGERISNNYIKRLDANLNTVLTTIEKYGIDAEINEIKEGMAAHYFRRARIISINESVCKSVRELMRGLRCKLSIATLRTASRILGRSIINRIRAARS